jgi:hypothetical protein
MCLIAVEWQTRNANEERLFEFDSTTALEETLWKNEQYRQEKWSAQIERDYHDALIKFLVDVQECIGSGVGARTSFGDEGSTDSRVLPMASALIKGRQQVVTVHVRSLASASDGET